MAVEALRELFSSFLSQYPVEDDVVQACVDVNFVGQLEGAEFDFSGFDATLEDVIPELTKIVLDHNNEGVIVDIENGEISLKNVITVLGFAMEKGNDKTVQSSIYALLAARTYLLLSCLHSSHMFGIYHSTLFFRAITAYRGVYLLKHLRGSEDSSSKGKKKAAPPPKKKNVASTTVLSSSTMNTSSFPSDVSDNATPQQYKAMSDFLFHSLEELYIYLQQDNIAVGNKSFGSVIDLIRLICRFDYSSSTRALSVESLREFKTLRLFSDRCFALAHAAMAEKHNREDMVLARFCLPRLTFRSFESAFMKGSMPQSLIQMANVMMKFLEAKFEGADIHDYILLKRLAENICHRCMAERIEYRSKSLEVALQLVKMLPQELIQQFFFFAVNYGYLTSQRCRLIAVDLICMLLDNFDMDNFPIGVPILKNVDFEFGAIFEAVEYDDNRFHQVNPTFKKHWEKMLYFEGENDFNPRHAMLQLLVRASMDKNPVVRCRGLCGILPFMKTKDGYIEMTRHAKEFIDTSRVHVMKILSEVNQFDERITRDTQTGSQQTQTQSQEQRALTPVPTEVHQNAQEEAQFLTKVSAAPFADLIIQRCNDKSPVTRKFTVPIIEALLTVETNPVYQKALLQKLQDFCRDPSVVVRKLGAEAMTNIVRDEEVFKQAWLHTVLPMVNDREETVEKSCRKMFFDKIVLPIIANDGSEALSWNMMIEIAKTTEFMRAFRRCFQQVARDDEYKRILHRLAKVLYGAIKVDAVASSAWMLLDYLADVIDIDPALAIHSWVASDENTGAVDPNVRIVTSPSELVSILSIILKRQKDINIDDRNLLRDSIALRFVKLKLHETVISDAIIVFVGLMSIDGTSEDVELLYQFFTDLIKKYYNDLITLPAEDFDLSMAERKKRICRRLLSMGQSALHAPKATNTDMINLLTHILSVEAPALDERTKELLSRPETRHGPPSQNPAELSLLQLLPLTEITGDICAAAVLAMGKIILANEDLARDYLQKLAVVHGTSIHAGVRNNVIYVLAACYLRYTTKMDIIQPAFLHGLRDRVDFVRYHALIHITELLRSQYMKMSALVLARLLPLLLDPEISIREALKGETLAVIEDQFPNVYVDNFVTCMFLFNKVGFGAYKEIERYEMPENPICFLNHDFSGALRRKQRMEMYKFMLKKFRDDSQRFLLISQISKTIFGSIVEGKIPFDSPEAKQLILDGCLVLELPEAKLTLEEGQADADNDDEVATEEIQKLARATIKIAFQSAYVTHIMPQLMAMAKFLSENKSPLQKEFRNCLAVIAEAYPDQLHVLFQESSQLKIEIEAELRRRKKDARKSRMAKNKHLVDNIARAAEVAASTDNEQTPSVDKENKPPINDDGVKTEPMDTQQEQPANPDGTVNISFNDIVDSIEKTVISDPQADKTLQVAVKEEPVDEESIHTALEPSIRNLSLEKSRDEADETAIDLSIHKSNQEKIKVEETAIELSVHKSNQEKEHEVDKTAIEPSIHETTQEKEEIEKTAIESSIRYVSPEKAPKEVEKTAIERSQILVTPPPREQPQLDIDLSPKQPVPKRPRLSLNRIEAIRADEMRLPRTSLIDSPVPKIFQGLRRQMVAPPQPLTFTSESELASITTTEVGRLHSTPVKDGNALNFTFGMDISAISPISRTRTRTRTNTNKRTLPK